MNKRPANHWRGLSADKLSEIDHCYMEITGRKRVREKDRDTEAYAFFVQGIMMGAGMAILSMMEEEVPQ